MSIRKAYNLSQLTWYEIEIVDRSQASINIVDELFYPIESMVYFRTKEEMINFIEQEAEKKYKIGLTTGIYSSGRTYAECRNCMKEMTITKLGNNLYLAKATEEYTNPDATPWMLLRIRKHVVSVPDTIMRYNLERFANEHKS